MLTTRVIILVFLFSLYFHKIKSKTKIYTYVYAQSHIKIEVQSRQRKVAATKFENVSCQTMSPLFFSGESAQYKKLLKGVSKYV